MKPTNFPNRKARRRAEAQARDEKYGKLTPAEKLETIRGRRALKQRKKLTEK